MGFWAKTKSLFVQKKPTPFPQSATLVFGQETPQAASAGSVLALYSTNGYLRALLDKVSDGVSGARFHVYKRVVSGKTVRDFGLSGSNFDRRERAITAARGSSDLIEVPNHRFLQIWENPCEQMTGTQVRRLLQLYLDAVGECFLLLSRDSQGFVNGFTPIPPSCVASTPSKGVPYYRVGFETLEGDIAASEMLHFKHPNPAYPLRRGVGLGAAVKDELDASESIATAIKSAMGRGGMPVAAIGVSDGPGAPGEAVDDFKDQFDQNFGRPDQAGKVLIAAGKLSQTSFSANFKELQTQELSRELLSYVRACFGISAEALGDLSSGDRSKAEAARWQLADTVIAPRIEFLRDCLQKWLIPLIDPDAILHYEDVRPQERERIQALMTNNVTAPAFTMNEARILAGYAPLKELEGKHLLPMPGQFAPSAGQDGQPSTSGQ